MAFARSSLTLLVVLLLCPCALALLTGPNATGITRSLWDQEGFIDPADGTWHVWYDNDYCHDGKRGAGISNYGHFTSRDGVHWTDRGIGMSPWSVCPCGTDVVPATAPCAAGSGPVAGIGSGSAWAVPGSGSGKANKSSSNKTKYVINYSTNKRGDQFGQEISFSTADSLMGPWVPATDVPAYHEDGKLYKAGRWDTIMQFTDDDGTMFGWWTATPADGSVGFGHGQTADGLHWTSLPPAKVDLPGLTGTQLEVGGVAKLPDGKWYAHACAIAWGHVSGLGGCFNVVADSPGGPYNRTSRNWALLAYDAHDGIPAYFSRPFLGPDGISLVNYIHGGHMSPLKHAVVDPSDGVLRWVWWSGNDALRGAPQPLPAAAATLLGPQQQQQPRVLLSVEVAHGSIVEGELVWGTDADTAVALVNPNTPNTTASRAGGFFRLSGGSNDSAVVAGTSSWSTLDLGKALPPPSMATAVGKWVNSSHQGLTLAAPEPSRGLDFRLGDRVSWRLLVRQGLYEVYFAKSSSAPHAPVYYFGAAYGAANSMACIEGQVMTVIELHGGFAQSSTTVTVHGMSLDTHDIEDLCDPQ